MRFTQTEKETEKKVNEEKKKNERKERNWIQKGGKKMRNLQMLAEVANVQTVYAKRGEKKEKIPKKKDYKKPCWILFASCRDVVS